MTTQYYRLGQVLRALNCAPWDIYWAWKSGAVKRPPKKGGRYLYNEAHVRELRDYLAVKYDPNALVKVMGKEEVIAK